MEAELKKRWIAALRSGEYKQSEGMLAVLVSDPELSGACFPAEKCISFCCLGVLGALIDPKCVQYPDFLESETRRLCIHWNDTAGLTFNEIADKLEKNDEI
jgi:hypothetical protein